MDKRRKTARLSIEEIPEVLQKPILLYNDEEVKSKIENLSSFGVGLVIDRNFIMDKGDIFYLKYHSLDSDIKCVCVYSDEDENGRSIGAYFTDSADQRIIQEILHVQFEN